MLDARFVPLLKWPYPPARRKAMQYRTHYNQTLDRLEYELGKLKATDIVIQAGFTREQLRSDGWPKVGVAPSHPGVILSFIGKAGPLSFPCDTYERFEMNMHALALSLEALRAVDRHGITRAAEQYKGWAQIEAPKQDGQMNTETAALFLGGRSDISYVSILQDSDVYVGAYKIARVNCHPDSGGTHDLFVTLGHARAILDRHHGIRKESA